MAGSPRQSTETAPAKEAFADYVAMGPARSLRGLASSLAQRAQYKSETAAFNSLARWSTLHHWQDRIANAATDRADRLLREAAELDAETFRATSDKLRREVLSATISPTMVIAIRDSVRKPAPRGGTSIDLTVNISMEQRKIAEQIAADRGLNVDDVLAEVNELLGLSS